MRAALTAHCGQKGYLSGCRYPALYPLFPCPGYAPQPSSRWCNLSQFYLMSNMI